MITFAASGPKNKSRSKATPALNSRLTRYLSFSLGACALGSQESYADIVNIDVGPTGFNINGLNGGANSGSTRSISNFPIAGTNNTLLISNGFNNFGVTTWGIGGNFSNLAFAVTSFTYAKIQKFAASNSISGVSTNFSSSLSYTAFKFNTTSVANFSNTDYVGFRFGPAGSFNYGWLQTTWDNSTNTFQINSGAYESTVNTAILAGAAAPVPEPGTLTLGSLALLAGGGAAVRRYRKQRQSQSASTTNATDPVTPVA